MGKKLKSILIVDDEENARLGLTKLLAKEGFSVASVGNGFEALQYLKDNKPHVVVTDINMPGMNGLTFLRELNRLYPGIDVIMITAFGEIESYIEAMNLGAFEYINKPVNVEDLKKILDKLFSKKSGRPPSGVSRALEP